MSQIPASHFLVAGLCVTSATLTVFGDGVSSSLAAFWFARDVLLVLAPLVASSAAALVVGAVSRADGEVVLGATVGAENVLGAFYAELFEGHRLWYCDPYVKAVAAAAKRRAWAVVFDWNKAN